LNYTFIKYFLSLVLFLSNIVLGGVGILNGLIHEINVVPGNTYKGFIEMNNSSLGEQVVTLYQTDIETSFTGETFYSDTLNNQRSNLKWIILNSSNITLAEKEIRTIEFEISVPNNDSLYGSYWSVIMIEPRDPIHIQKDDRGFSIQSKIRYAIQIVCNMGETGVTDLKFLNISQSFREGKRLLEVDVQNTGDVIVNPTLSLELFDELGNSPPILRVENKRVFPNSSKKYIINVDDIKPGLYQGILMADCGTDDLFGVNLTLNIKDDG